MKLAIAAILMLVVGFCQAVEERHEHEKHHKQEEEKEVLLHEKWKTHFVMEKARDFFLNSPNRQFERQCFAKFNPGESVDFVIDLAPSPSFDEVDKSVAESPIALYLEIMTQSWKRSPSKSYFKSVSQFIDFVTFDMKPEATHSIIYDNGRRFYIRGKSIEAPATEAISRGQGGDFSDSVRNLKTMWPSTTKSIHQSFLYPALKNDLGRMTELALWNRDNGLPSVLGASRRSKPVYTIVITDGASGAHIKDLIGEKGELGRTTVIDIGNRRFVRKLDWNDMRHLVSVVTLSAPQQLASMIDTCRTMACRLCGC